MKLVIYYVYHSYAYFVYLLQYFKLIKGWMNMIFFDDKTSVLNNVQCANCVHVIIIITFIYVDIRTCTNNSKNI